MFLCLGAQVRGLVCLPFHFGYGRVGGSLEVFVYCFDHRSSHIDPSNMLLNSHLVIEPREKKATDRGRGAVRQKDRL